MSRSEESYFYDYDYDTQTIMVYANQQLLQWITSTDVCKQSTPAPPSSAASSTTNASPHIQISTPEPGLYPGNTHDEKSDFPPSHAPPAVIQQETPPKHVQHAFPPSSSSCLTVAPRALVAPPPQRRLQIMRPLQPIVVIYYHKLCCWFDEAKVSIQHQDYQMVACYKTEQSTLYRAIIRLPAHLMHSETINGSLSFHCWRADEVITKRHPVEFVRNDKMSDEDQTMVVFSFDEEEYFEEEAHEIEHDQYHWLDNYSDDIKQFIRSDTRMLKKMRSMNGMH